MEELKRSITPFGDACLAGESRAGETMIFSWREVGNFIEGDLVVAAHLHVERRVEFTQSLTRL